MKYIKKYNESMNDININSDIKDICAELKDEGYDIEVINDGKEINLYIGNNGDTIEEDPLILEVINRVIEYMLNLKYNYKIELELRNNYEFVDSINDIFKKRPLDICLIFKA